LLLRSSVDTSELAISVTVVDTAFEITNSFVLGQFSGSKCVFVLARRFLSASCRTERINYREMFGYSVLAI
jgi:hypothetical protein